MMLTAREKIVLGEIVQHFIYNAVPVGSSLIARKSRLGMSAATIRNVMADLERKGYIYQPYTSAGRVPNTRGYRIYVNDLMKRARLSPEERNSIRETVQQTGSEFDEVLKEVSRILAHLAKQLGVIISPRIEQGAFERMEIVRISQNRILVVISIQSGLVKTIMLEINSRISEEKLHLVSQILNERLYGMKLSDIRRKFADIVKDIRHEDSGLVRLILSSANRLFDFEENIDVYYMGTHYMVQQPDFPNVEKVSSVVEALEDPHVMVHLLDEEKADKRVSIKIGEEIQEERMQDCSIITAQYRIGTVTGTLGVIGPTRMNYSKLVVLVEYTAQTITDILNKN